jgi:hypothetical protein
LDALIRRLEAMETRVQALERAKDPGVARVLHHCRQAMVDR